MSSAQGDARSHDPFDLREFLARLNAYKRWIGGSVALFTVGFTLAALVMTPVYRAEVVVAPTDLDSKGLGSLNDLSGGLGSLAALAGITLGSGSRDTDQALAVLGSRQFTETFFAEGKLVPILYAKRWDSVRQTWKPSMFGRQPTAADAFKRFDRHIRSVVQDKKTGLVHLTIDWKNRFQAADWANDLIRRINIEMRARAIAKADASINYLETELSRTVDVGTRDAVNRLIASQIYRRMVATVTQEYAFEVVDRALVPDEHDPLRPKLPVMLMLGLALGLILGCGAALVAAELK